MRNRATGKPVVTAAALLNSYLTPEQRTTYRAHSVIFVVSRRDGHVYAIGAGRLGYGQYVFPLYNGHPTEMLHVWAADYHYGRNLQAESSILAQLLFLECNPRRLIDTACRNSVNYDHSAIIAKAGPPPMVNHKLAGWVEPPPRPRRRRRPF
jgi:hypothetical protein